MSLKNIRLFAEKVMPEVKWPRTAGSRRSNHSRRWSRSNRSRRSIRSSAARVLISALHGDLSPRGQIREIKNLMYRNLFGDS